MTIQRTLLYGPCIGVLTGIGSSTADCLYVCIGVFGLTFISDFFLQYQVIIHILGGCFILFLGIRMFLKKESWIEEKAEKAGIAKIFLTSFIVGITNPAAILTFLFAFSYFGIAGPFLPLEGAQLVLGVFIGTLIWWISLSAIVGIIKNKSNDQRLKNINRGLSVILILFGISIFTRAIV